MASWSGAARTNYFSVKNLEAFKKTLEPVMGEIEVAASPKRPRKVALLAVSEYGDFPSRYWDEDSGEDIDFDLVDVVSEHLVRGEIAVFQTAGAEKLRYVTGHAVAVDSRGRRVSVDLDAIYQMAARKFRVKIGSIELAQY